MKGFLKKNKYEKLYSEASIQTALFKKYFDTNSFLLRNRYIYDWESDFFYVLGKGSKGFGVEHEIKKTHSDWVKETKTKEKKHKFLMETFESRGANLTEGKKELYCPSYFIVTCPKDLITLDEVEDNFPYASLYWVDGEKIVVKKKLKIHNVKQDYKELLIFKLYDEIVKHEFRLKDLETSLLNSEDNNDCCALLNNYLKKNRLK